MTVWLVPFQPIGHNAFGMNFFRVAERNTGNHQRQGRSIRTTKTSTVDELPHACNSYDTFCGKLEALQQREVVVCVAVDDHIVRFKLGVIYTCECYYIIALITYTRTK